ncbi:hypothetical protein [Novosphingobium sp.]|uniref:hypothetical protein n=1 Tax=Novosphingobium sp. TaxID=1874826 RepID=UPI002FD9AB77
MSDPVDPRDPASRPPVFSHGWDADRKVRFLHHLSEKGDVRAAAARVGMSRQSAYMQRRRDGVFAQGWQAALVLARVEVEDVLATRALDGVEEEVWFRGELVGVRRRYDSRLLLAHLARLDALNETIAGEQAERFDEVLALLTGERPEPALFRASPFPKEPDPVLPLAREEFADSAATLACNEEYEEWHEAYVNLEAAKEDEPEPDYDGRRTGFLRDWDKWQASAFERVDRALAASSGSDDLPHSGSGRKDDRGEGEGGDLPPAEYKSLAGRPALLPLAGAFGSGPVFTSAAAIASGLCKPCQPVALSKAGHGWANADRAWERNAGFAVIAYEGRRGPPPTPPTTAPADLSLKDRKHQAAGA